MKVKEYYFVFGSIPNYGTIVNAVIDLENKVNAKIKEGWQPFGGIAITKENAFQAMVKYEEDEE